MPDCGVIPEAIANAIASGSALIEPSRKKASELPTSARESTRPVRGCACTHGASTIVPTSAPAPEDIIPSDGIPSDAQQQAPQEIKPEDALNGILKDILR